MRGLIHLTESTGCNLRHMSGWLCGNSCTSLRSPVMETEGFNWARGSRYWVAVKELRLTYHNGYIYIYIYIYIVSNPEQDKPK